MKNAISAAAFALLAAASPIALHAAPTLTTVNPTSDGSLYVCSGCIVVQNDAYLMAAGYIQGAVKFAARTVNGHITKALLSLNPYGMPLWDKTLEIYGYGTAEGQLTLADADAGT